MGLALVRGVERALKQFKSSLDSFVSDDVTGVER